MRFGDFGQPRVQEILKDVLSQHRLAGSFLFDGPAGVGKEALAVESGRILNCERAGGCEPRGLFRSTPVEDDGQACSSCRRFFALQHPDLHLIFPVPAKLREAPAEEPTLAGDWRQKKLGSLREILLAKAQDPYFKPLFEAPSGIQADVIRDVVLPVVQRKPVEARTKVVILADAEQMAFGIGNLLLKTLEEPPADCLLVLTSSVSERLLPTIRSRCQRFRFTPLPTAWMVPRLQILHGIGAAEARQAAFLSQGSMLAAGRYLTGVMKEVRERALAILLAGARCDTLELMQRAHATAKDYAGQRQLFPLLLQLMMSMARDALLLGEGIVTTAPAAATRRGSKSAPAAATPAGPQLVHEDQLASLRQLAQSFDAQALRRIVRLAQRTERQIAGYAHAEMTLGTFFLALARESSTGRAMAARA